MLVKQQLCGLGLLVSLVFMVVFSEWFGLWAGLGSISAAYLSVTFLPRRVESKVLIAVLAGLMTMLTLSLMGGVYYYFDQSRLQNKYAAN
jgi:hypothetical protein